MNNSCCFLFGSGAARFNHAKKRLTTIRFLTVELFIFDSCPPTRNWIVVSLNTIDPRLAYHLGISQLQITPEHVTSDMPSAVHFMHMQRRLHELMKSQRANVPLKGEHNKWHCLMWRYCLIKTRIRITFTESKQQEEGIESVNPGEGGARLPAELIGTGLFQLVLRELYFTRAL